MWSRKCRLGATSIVSQSEGIVIQGSSGEAEVPTPEVVREQLDRILQSGSFARSKRMARFIRFVVEQTLAGEDENLSEYAIGLQVFDRVDDFDPRIDSIVRVDARRLRSKLQEYYQGDGAGDPLVIDVPKGTYVPQFRSVEASRTGDVTAEASGESLLATVEAATTDVPRPHEGLDQPVEDAPRSKPTGRRRTLALGAAAALIVLLLVSLRLATTPDRAIGSIAVLPLQNFSNDAKQNYFVDGMHEALIAELAQISALTVISRTSVSRYRGTEKSIPEIAAELNVDVVVEGSVLKAGDDIRITAQLIGTNPERHLWANSYEGDMRDVLRLQSEVGQAIAAAIHVAVTPEERGRLASTREVVPEAYRHYLLGRQLCSEMSVSELYRGVDQFRQVIDLDPSYAPAHAGLARCYTILGLYFLPAKEVEPTVKAAVIEALRLDPDLAEAHAMNGHMKLFFDRDFSGQQDFERALELDPNSVTALLDYGWYLTVGARFDEARAVFLRAANLDPQGPTTFVYIGWGSYMARRYDEAILHCRKAIELDPEIVYGHMVLGAAYAGQGMVAEAAAAVAKAEALAPLSVDQNVLQSVGWVYADIGKDVDALRLIDQLRALSPQIVLNPARVAIIYGALGDLESAFQWLNMAIEEGTVLHFLRTHPQWDSMRSDPRFDELLKKAALQAPSGATQLE